MKLVICEKPSVAKAVASALGVTSRPMAVLKGMAHRFLVCGTPDVPDGCSRV